VVNSQYQPFSKLKVSAEVYDFDLKKQFSNQAETDAAADSSTRVFSIPESAVGSSSISFVKLSLDDASGHSVSSNFYWLPAKSSSFDWDKTTFVHTPSPAYEDLTALNNLSLVKLQSSSALALKGDAGAVTVQVKNPSNHLAFQVCLEVLDKNGDKEILPVLWDDNYFSLMPGESKTVSAVFDRRQLQHVQPEVRIGGWNILSQTKSLSLSPSQKKVPSAQARKP
jgi:exo-1,4-beta-D-glucosaminidase